MKAYCVKCREKTIIKDPQADYNAVGAPVTKGTCSVCGTRVYRMGRTEAHEGLPKPEVTRKKKKQRKGKLVIVESPAKAKTVSRFLGKGYTVRASVGHVRDLLRSKLSVDIENDFQPRYRVPNEKREVVKELKTLAKKAEQIYLATDPDREGEAIAWHLMEAADIEKERTNRVVFHEITKEAVAHAFAEPRGIDMDLVNAQQARRILDRLVGYGISPILWKKVRNRLSAGRVQSVAVRLIVEREREIEAFEPVEYWSIEADFLPEGGSVPYRAKLAKIDDVDPDLSNSDVTDAIIEDMHKSSYFVRSIKHGTRRRKPSAPFITSTLQQDASRKLGFTARKTMRIAQQLYEGMELDGQGTAGLITYMRTDSTNISKIALKEVREFVKRRYGEGYLPAKASKYKTRTRSAQEAHEAVRPTSVLREPKSIKKYLSGDQFRLYQLIWKRFVSSQMMPALYKTLAIEIQGNGDDHVYLLRASGSQLQFPGFLTIYEEGKDEDQKEEQEGDSARIPIVDIKEKQTQLLKELLPLQHFTQPPPRYTEASLVQVLEENGIGRPSTYAAILSTIQNRGYVTRAGSRLEPTETGFLVNDLVVEFFPTIVDVNFTSRLEGYLDEIASGDQAWVKVISDFYTPFSEKLAYAEKVMPEKKAELEKVGRSCPKCGHDLIIRWGRFGKFISCSNFPECRYTEPYLEKIGMICPKCKEGDVVRRKTRKRRTFYGCSRYPDCDFTSWKQPVPKPCPNCGGTLVMTNKHHLQCLACKETFLQDKILQETELA
ncbi:MAG: type I DNA topoisomerase [Chloroflexota bacterium]|nr:type I DNA topoisomerase [Chloroflexota bacterium]